MKKIKITGLTIVFLFLAPAAMLAQCVVPFEVGSWKNMNSNTNGITRVEVTFSCNDVVYCPNGVCQDPPPPYTIHIWGKCSPSDCDWGTAPGTTYHSSDGTVWKYFFYNQGFARRYVYIKPSSLYPGRLFLWMYTDFTDPSRADYVMQNWFDKQLNP